MAEREHDNKHFEVRDGEIYLTNEQREFVKAVYTLAELDNGQSDIIKALERGWNATIIVYERK